jgi:hypothetical protein
MIMLQILVTKVFVLLAIMQLLGNTVMELLALLVPTACLTLALTVNAQVVTTQPPLNTVMALFAHPTPNA